MSRVVPLPAANTVVDNAVAIINADGSVATIGQGAVAATLYADQQVVTASAVALTAQALVNGLTLRAKASNVGPVFVGGSGVTPTDDGTGNGFVLPAGASVSLPVSNASAVYIIGTANDIVYVAGN
jgi:hypothetical protein